MLAITLHEAAHGYAALALGDDTASGWGGCRSIRCGTWTGSAPSSLPGFLLIVQLLTHRPRAVHVRLGQAGAGRGLEDSATRGAA